MFTANNFCEHDESCELEGENTGVGCELSGSCSHDDSSDDKQLNLGQREWRVNVG